MDSFGITCKCGHCDDYEKFEVDEHGRDLPAGVYRCASCGQSWTLEKCGQATFFDNGMVIPPPHKVVEL